MGTSLNKKSVDPGVDYEKFTEDVGRAAYLKLRAYEQREKGRSSAADAQRDEVTDSLIPSTYEKKNLPVLRGTSFVLSRRSLHPLPTLMESKIKSEVHMSEAASVYSREEAPVSSASSWAASAEHPEHPEHSTNSDGPPSTRSGRYSPRQVSRLPLAPHHKPKSDPVDEAVTNSVNKINLKILDPLKSADGCCLMKKNPPPTKSLTVLFCTEYS
ncbi:hypothetical protein E4U51_003488 [Claviceps purpurea]|nr:hypothetical protein E4U51_003488 [Claviceps purpurea]